MQQKFISYSSLLLLNSFLQTEAFAPSSSVLLKRRELDTIHPLSSRRIDYRKDHAHQSYLLQNPTNEHKMNSRIRATLSLHKLWKQRQSNLKFSSSSIVKETSSNQLDATLSRLTSAFPFFVLGSAILGLIQPSTLMWTNRGTLISWMLASVMCATGLTLERKDFTKVLGEDLAAVPAGVLCQFIIMPITAFLVGRKLLLNSGISYGASLFLGLCLVGCSPGGTASNLVSLIAKADVALSVLLTSCSTVLASIVTPLLVKFLVGSTIDVSGWALCEATARVVLFPVIFGMFVNAKAPTLASRVSRFTPFASVLLVSLICGGVVAQNSAMFLASKTMIPLIVGSVLSLHCVGFFAGYFVPRWGLGFSEMTSRTISIETGMQNSALAVVLARSIGAPAVASLPGALSATAHSCLGSVLAAYWHGRQSVEVKKKGQLEQVEVDSRVEQEANPHMVKSVVEETIGPEDKVSVLVGDEKEESVAVVAGKNATDMVSADIDSRGVKAMDNDTDSKVSEIQALHLKDDSPDANATSSVVDDNADEVEGKITETRKLLKQIKDSGLAGVISYAAWELAFWTASVPVCLFGYLEVTGHWPDLSDKDDLAKLGAEAFAFVNFARFAVPLRIGLALGTIPWIQENIVDRFLESEDGKGFNNDDPIKYD